MVSTTQSPNSCTVIRRALLTRGTLQLNSSEITMAGQDWVTGPCNTPLFGDAEKARGTCNSCHKGWTHPHNYRVDAG